MRLHQTTCLVSLLILGICSLPARAATQPPFRDIMPGYWAAPAITDLAQAQIMRGFPDGTFQPTHPMTRAQFVATAYRLVTGNQPGPTSAAPYGDVPATAWYASAAALARQNSWLPFPTGQSFSPNQPITREEAAAVLGVAFVGVPAGGAAVTPLSWNDASAIVPVARPGVAAAAADGLVLGYDNGSFQPLGTLNRAEAATILDRALKQLVVSGDKRFRMTGQLQLVASAYGDAEPGIGSTTATGTPVRVGEMAVDPSVVPLGTYLWITGYQSDSLPAGGLLEHAEDTGGSIRGNRIDLYMSGSQAQINGFGLQTVTGYTLAPLP